MGSKILIDTNIAIGYIGNSLNDQLMDQVDDILNGQYYLSVINKIELLGFPNLSLKEEEKFKLFIDHSMLLPIDKKVIERTIRLKKRQKIKLPGAIIAATCIEYGLKILTLNKKDFENIEDLELVIADFK